MPRSLPRLPNNGRAEHPIFEAVSRDAPVNIPPNDDKILLVDDDPAVLEGLRRVLVSEGWCVISAASGEEALEYLDSHHPKLMITDLSMADVSGWDLLFHENLQRPNLPVFVITALPIPESGGAESFADEFFQKPLDFDRLLSAVRRTLDPTPRPISDH